MTRRRKYCSVCGKPAYGFDACLSCIEWSKTFVPDSFVDDYDPSYTGIGYTNSPSIIDDSYLDRYLTHARSSPPSPPPPNT